MSRSSSVKQEFLKNWIKICRNMKKEEASSILERKNAIKLSADAAMAAPATTQWRRALLDDVVSRNPSILGHCSRSVGGGGGGRYRYYRSRILRRRGGGVVPHESQCGVLRKLVPGGEDMDAVSLIRETLDYIVSLRLQVDVMRHLAAASSIPAHN